MIDPIAFTIPGVNIAVHWYGIIMMVGILLGTWITAREVRRLGGNPDHVWDGLTWAMPAGVVGARLWYVVTDILGGGRRYLEDPVSIFRIPEGGLHFYGAILFGALVAYVYARRNKVDMWLIIDGVAPALLISQAAIRPANYINQELYGPPTDLPWGISISAANRIPPWHNLSFFPEETTRFHPTFAYEMIWNLLAAGLLLWTTRRFSKKMRPGVPFAAWLILAGVGRAIIETWRPDQPHIPGTPISYTRLVAALMAIGGVILMLVKYGVLRLPFLSQGPDTYAIAPADSSQSEAASEMPG
jgi:phosphatidylglycerol:prolipoprotein diacylglycerol transferase